MSRLNLVVWGIGVMLLSNVPLAWAQMNADIANQNSIGNAGINNSGTVDLTMPSVSDPAAVDMLFKEGNTIASILEGLKGKGFHIRYKEKHFGPTMTLLSIPQSTSIDDLLREIVEPWNFRVYRSPLGHLVVTPNKNKASPAPKDETHEKLKNIIGDTAGG